MTVAEQAMVCPASKLVQVCMDGAMVGNSCQAIIVASLLLAGIFVLQMVTPMRNRRNSTVEGDEA